MIDMKTDPIITAAEKLQCALAAEAPGHEQEWTVRIHVALLALAFSRLLRGARKAPVRAAIAAGFFALVLHTWLYAAFLEDPVTWTLLVELVGSFCLPFPYCASGD